MAPEREPALPTGGVDQEPTMRLDSPSRGGRWVAAGLLLVLVLLPASFYVWVTSATAPRGLEPLRIDDFSGLRPTRVAERKKPRTIAELRQLIGTHPGPVSIVGASQSMGGQNACAECLAIEMGALDHVLELDERTRTVRVEAGISWRALQGKLDARGLSIANMQAYANFTVGGSLAANAHGPYPGQGPIVNSVLQIGLVLANGELVHASRSENSELFYGSIGSFGALGVIVEATLRLASNGPLQKSSTELSLAAYSAHVRQHVQGHSGVVLHRAKLYPGSYSWVRSETWTKTREALTETRRLAPPGPPTLFAATLQWLVAEVPFGHDFMRRIHDPLAARRSVVAMRNFEASRDVLEVALAAGPWANAFEEYCFPVDRLGEFVRALSRELNARRPGLVSASLSHSPPDPGTLLAWAREESFCVTLHSRVGTSLDAQHAARAQSRALIELALAHGGVPSLAYAHHATPRQVARAYPRLDELAALKTRVDPQHRLRNELWDHYLPTEDLRSAAARDFAEIDAAQRPEQRAFLDLPHQLVRFSAQEMAEHLRREPPSTFPFLESVVQLWTLERAVLARVRDYYPEDAAAQAESLAMTLAFSSELFLKGFYEATVGRFTEWLACGSRWGFCSTEDRYAAKLANDYAEFLRTDSWYEFPFDDKLVRIQDLDDSASASKVRSLERKTLLLLEYGAKAAYAATVQRGADQLLGSFARESVLWIERPSTVPLPEGIASVAHHGNEELVRVPRHRRFDAALRSLFALGLKVRAVAGNERVSLCVALPRGQAIEARGVEETVRWPVLTDPARERALLFLPVEHLNELLTSLEAQHITVEHVLEY